MSMTNEEAITNLEKLAALFHTESEQSKMVDYSKIIETLEFAAAALRPITREQVEKVFPGCEKCRNQANWPSWIEKGFVYCPKCGTPLTSWAWEKQMERLEGLKDGL